MINPHWEKEEFEDLIARGLTAMYESKIAKHARKCLKPVRLSEELLQRIRSLGCYFAPEDRICFLTPLSENSESFHKIQEIDSINDGRPEKAIYCHIPEQRIGTIAAEIKAYLSISYIERISNLPSPFKCDFEGKTYRVIDVLYPGNGCIEGISQYVRINKEGKVFGAYRIVYDYNPITNRPSIEKIDGSPFEEWELAQDRNTFIAASTIQFYQDRRYLWNVTAKEKVAKATFGVYPEQIQSLFYARELPMTVTGRKRPILHWVNAHQRRIKSGIDIDIEKHLRGINEFVMDGTKFEITRPQKVVNK